MSFWFFCLFVCFQMLSPTSWFLILDASLFLGKLPKFIKKTNKQKQNYCQTTQTHPNPGYRWTTAHVRDTFDIQVQEWLEAEDTFISLLREAGRFRAQWHEEVLESKQSTLWNDLTTKKRWRPCPMWILMNWTQVLTLARPERVSNLHSVGGSST